uniref:Uncharacterized protein n=1 Tax=Globodera rostochiensis TaxID=31243 RepID=A0A914HGM6_GLORO
MSTSSPNSTDSDLTADKGHVSPPFVWPIAEMADELAELAQRQRPDSPTPTESGYDLVSNVGGQNDEGHVSPTFVWPIAEMADELAELAQRQRPDSPTPTESGYDLVSNVGGQNDEDGTEIGNDGTEVRTDPVAATLQHDKISEHQQHPITIGRPPEKKKCLALLQVERKAKLTTDCRNLLYEFFMTETEQFFASGDEHCNPTVGHMMQTLLPKHFAMSMEQLTEMFDRQLQLLHTEFGEFFDIAPGEWCAERVKDRGKYKVLLHPKLYNNSANRNLGARKNVPEKVGAERLCDDDVPMKGQQKANKEAGRRLEDVPMSEEQNADNDWEPIDRTLLSGKHHLGNLHNVHSVTSNDLGFMRKKSNTRSPTEQRALKPYNDSIEECILLSIQDAERFVVESDREADRKLQMEKIKGFKELLSLYNDRKKLIDTINASNSIGPKVIKAEDVTKCFEELCKLPIFGPIIKQMYEVQQKSREDNAKEYKEEEAGTGFMPKPSRTGMPGNLGEQYLNGLERQSPINFFDKLRKTSRRYGANNSQMASGSAGFRQQPESTNFDSFRRRIPVVSSFYNRVWPSSAQPPQQQQFESFSSVNSSTSRFSNNRFNGRTPSNGNQSRFGQRPMER